MTAGLRRPEQRSLFLPVNPVTRDITKQSISFQIVKAVKLAYNFLDRSPPPGIKAHDVRGVAAGASLEDIMDAGQWSSPSTFYRYYEKALTSGQVQTLRQIPVFVSARRCIFFLLFLRIKGTDNAGRDRNSSGRGRRDRGRRERKEAVRHSKQKRPKGELSQ